MEIIMNGSLLFRRCLGLRWRPWRPWQPTTAKMAANKGINIQRVSLSLWKVSHGHTPCQQLRSFTWSGEDFLQSRCSFPGIIWKNRDNLSPLHEELGLWAWEYDIDTNMTSEIDQITAVLRRIAPHWNNTADSTLKEQLESAGQTNGSSHNGDSSSIHSEMKKYQGPNFNWLPQLSEGFPGIYLFMEGRPKVWIITKTVVFTECWSPLSRSHQTFCWLLKFTKACTENKHFTDAC